MSRCEDPLNCVQCSEHKDDLGLKMAALNSALEAERLERQERRRNSLPPRTPQEKVARVVARARRKSQKRARRRNRR